MLPGLGLEGAAQHGGQVAARVAVRVLDLEARARRCRPRAPAPGAAPGSSEQSRTVAVAARSGSGAVAGGHELAQRDQVALAGQSLEGAGARRRAAAPPALPWQAL